MVVALVVQQSLLCIHGAFPCSDQTASIFQCWCYTHNPKLQYMSVPDRGLWLLQHYGIKVTDKEMIGMRLTDGLYDEANKSYYISYNRLI